jgi:hypothetical protein
MEGIQMRKTRTVMLIIACLMVSCLPAWAASRTTPVEVLNTPFVGIDASNSTVKAVQVEPWYMNILGTPNFNVANSPTVKIDGTTNTVKAAQSGTWNVGVSSMPTVNVNTHAVTQSGTWNVGISGTPNVNIANTPSVNVSNSPTVKIDATTNAVDTPTKHNAVQIWSTNQTIANLSTLTSTWIACAGYDELRFLLQSDAMSNFITVYIEFRSPSTEFVPAKAVVWSSGVTGGAFHDGRATLAISCPVYGDWCQVKIDNNAGVPVTVFRSSYAYLVN